MRRRFKWITALLLVLLLCGCKGNFATVNLQEAIEISEDGIVKQEVLEQIQEENAIGNFVGQSGDFSYEWTIFGSDIEDTKDINLLLSIEETEEGIKLLFGQTESFGFPALLSVHLNEKWDAQSAILYYNDAPLSSVSITGSKTSILNIAVSKIPGVCVVRAEEEPLRETEATQKAEQVAVENGTGKEAQAEEKSEVIPEKDNYLSAVKETNDRVYSDGSATGKDKYETDPIPEGKPLPVEPENQEVNTQVAYTCTFSIECSTILNNLSDLDPDKLELVPSNGVILPPTQVTFYEGESVYDVLQRVCQENGIHMEASWTPIYNSAYVEGIHNLYEFDCGELSGWMYRVDGWYPNYGSSRYQLTDGETVEWRYTCDLGRDVGCDWM